MKLAVIFSLIFGLIATAYINASSKQAQKIDLKTLRLQMSYEELESNFGAPFSRERNTLIYILEDDSQIQITLRDGLVASAVVKYHRPLRIEDPQLRQLTLVQMQTSELYDDKPSWFFAGKPEEGLIYKITQNGEIESLTWVPPFTYGAYQKKNLQALLHDFKNQHVTNL